MKFQCEQAVVDELRALGATDRALALKVMLEIEADPWSRNPNRIELPPMWRPGTYEETRGQIVIRYCQDSNTDCVRFLHVRIVQRWGGADVM